MLSDFVKLRKGIYAFDEEDRIGFQSSGLFRYSLFNLAFPLYFDYNSLIRLYSTPYSTLLDANQMEC